MKTKIGPVEVDIKSDQEIQYDKDYSDYVNGLYVTKVKIDQLSQFMHYYFSNQLSDDQTKKALKMLCK